MSIQHDRISHFFSPYADINNSWTRCTYRLLGASRSLRTEPHPRKWGRKRGWKPEPTTSPQRSWPKWVDSWETEPERNICSAGSVSFHVHGKDWRWSSLLISQILFGWFLRQHVYAWTSARLNVALGSSWLVCLYIYIYICIYTIICTLYNDYNTCARDSMNFHMSQTPFEWTVYGYMLEELCWKLVWFRAKALLISYLIVNHWLIETLQN